MKELKKLVPGSTFSLRIPTNIDQEVLDYINTDHGVKRNKYLLDLLVSKIKEEINGNSNILNVSLPIALNSEQKSALTQSIASFISIMMTDTQNEKVKEEEIDLSIYQGLIEED